MLRLLPVTGNVVEILGIGADLLKQRPLPFDVRQVLLALIFSTTPFDQPMLTPDALQGFVPDRQIEFTNQTARTECGGESYAARPIALRAGELFSGVGDGGRKISQSVLWAPAAGNGAAICAPWAQSWQIAAQ